MGVTDPGGVGAFVSPAIVAIILSLGRLKAMTGAPATIRSASATAEASASSVVRAFASGPKSVSDRLCHGGRIPQCDS